MTEEKQFLQEASKSSSFFPFHSIWLQANRPVPPTLSELEATHRILSLLAGSDIICNNYFSEEALWLLFGKSFFRTSEIANHTVSLGILRYASRWL